MDQHKKERLKREATQLKSNLLLWELLEELERDLFDQFKAEKEINKLQTLHARVQSIESLRDELDGRINEHAE